MKEPKDQPELETPKYGAFYDVVSYAILKNDDDRRRRKVQVELRGKNAGPAFSMQCWLRNIRAVERDGKTFFQETVIEKGDSSQSHPAGFARRMMGLNDKLNLTNAVAKSQLFDLYATEGRPEELFLFHEFAAKQNAP